MLTLTFRHIFKTDTITTATAACGILETKRRTDIGIGEYAKLHQYWAWKSCIQPSLVRILKSFTLFTNILRLSGNLQVGSIASDLPTVDCAANKFLLNSLESIHQGPAEPSWFMTWRKSLRSLLIASYIYFIVRLMVLYPVWNKSK